MSDFLLKYIHLSTIITQAINTACVEYELIIIIIVYYAQMFLTFSALSLIRQNKQKHFYFIINLQV